MTNYDRKELNDATFVALMDLKIATSDLKSALKLRGRFLDGQPCPIPYTEKELKLKRLIADQTARKARLLFDALWKARRRAQGLTT
jgi:hypothetical protein